MPFSASDGNKNTRILSNKYLRKSKTFDELLEMMKRKFIVPYKFANKQDRIDNLLDKMDKLIIMLSQHHSLLHIKTENETKIIQIEENNEFIHRVWDQIKENERRETQEVFNAIYRHRVKMNSYVQKSNYKTLVKYRDLTNLPPEKDVRYVKAQITTFLKKDQMVRDAICYRLCMINELAQKRLSKAKLFLGADYQT